MKKPMLYKEDGSEIELPTKWEICPVCDGRGKSSAYLGAFTAEEMAEEGREFQEDYMSGFYDRACDCCGGRGSIQVVDLAKMSKADREEYQAQCRADAEVEAEEAMERKYGC